MQKLDQILIKQFEIFGKLQYSHLLLQACNFHMAWNHSCSPHRDFGVLGKLLFPQDILCKSSDTVGKFCCVLQKPDIRCKMKGTKILLSLNLIHLPTVQIHLSNKWQWVLIQSDQVTEQKKKHRLLDPFSVFCFEILY